MYQINLRFQKVYIKVLWISNEFKKQTQVVKSRTVLTDRKSSLHSTFHHECDTDCDKRIIIYSMFSDLVYVRLNERLCNDKNSCIIQECRTTMTPT